MQIPQFVSALFGRKQAAPRAISSGVDYEDLADMQAMNARSFRPLEAPATMYSNVSAYIANLPIPMRQQLMIALYDTNLYVEHLTNRLINPLLGKTGFTALVPTTAPATKDVLDAFWEFDELNDIQQQERIVRDFLIVGEVFDLIAPCGESFYTAPLLPSLVEQTVTDPHNYHNIVGVKQNEGMGAYRYHPLVLTERRLSQRALELRESWRQAGGYDCLFLQNLKKTAPIPGNTLEPYEMYQKRGEPFLATSADLFRQLVDYLWTSLDRAQALNTFNWGFGVEMPERVLRGTQAEQEAYIARWKQHVGTPKPNTAFFYPKNVLEPHPFSFPSGVASAMEGLFKMMRNTAGWSAASRDEDMGDSDSRFASMKSPGMTNPTIETLVMLQKKVEAFHQRRAQYVLEKKAADGMIPRSEYETVRGKPRFQFAISSPEISKQDFGVAATTMNAFVQGWSAIAGRGVYTIESLIAGEQKMTKELYGIELEVDDAAVTRMQQQLSAPPVTETSAAVPAPRPNA